MTGENMRRLGEANKFRVWRAAESVKWNCTCEEIGKELGLSAGAVSAIMKRAGWSSRLPGLHSRVDVGARRQRVDVLINTEFYGD